MRNVKFLILLLLLLGIASCKTQRSAMHKSFVSGKPVLNEVLEHVSLPNSKFKTFEGKISLDLNFVGKKYSSRGTLKVKKDSVIQLSIQPLLGIEMFRLIITQKQITFINRIDQYYIQEPISKLNKEYGPVISYHTLEALFLNQAFLIDDKEINKKNISRMEISKEATGNTVLREKRKMTSKIVSSFLYDKQLQLKEAYIANKNDKISLRCNYANFEEQDKRFLFPTRMSFFVLLNAKKIDTKLAFSSITLDKTLNISDQVSAKYKRTTIKELIK